jgi:hypothetical protein
LHSINQLTTGDTRCRKGNIFSLDQVISAKYLVDVDAICLEFLTFLVIARPDFALYLSADALNSGSG